MKISLLWLIIIGDVRVFEECESQVRNVSCENEYSTIFGMLEKIRVV